MVGDKVRSIVAYIIKVVVHFFLQKYMNRNQAYQNHKLSDDLPTKELLHLGTNKLYYLIGNLLPKNV